MVINMLLVIGLVIGTGLSVGAALALALNCLHYLMEKKRL